MATTTKSKFLEVKQGKLTFILTTIPAGVVADISYVAVRGLTNEKGAVQRILNPRRISSIKDFTLAGGTYPNAVILNWVSKDNPLTRTTTGLSFKNIADSAQIIDGQHRIAGISAAIEESPKFAKLELPVVIFEQLSTRTCADIFLSINTEQKPVPRSLVFDLYGEASEFIVDPAAVRARDIAVFLNEVEGSPFYGEIKLPGDPTRKAGIALSTAVSAIKPLVEEKGIFEQIDVKQLEMQKQIIFNLFAVLRDKYGSVWLDRSNIFMYAAGFVAAMDFLKLKLIPYCNTQESFTTKTIAAAIKLAPDRLIVQEEVKGLGGKDAPKRVYERLVEAFHTKTKAAGKFEI